MAEIDGTFRSTDINRTENLSHTNRLSRQQAYPNLPKKIRQRRLCTGFYLGFNFRGCNPKAGVPSLPCPLPPLLPAPPFPPLSAPPLPLEVGPLKTS